MAGPKVVVQGVGEIGTSFILAFAEKMPAVENVGIDIKPSIESVFYQKIRETLPVFCNIETRHNPVSFSINPQDAEGADYHFLAVPGKNVETALKAVLPHLCQPTAQEDSTLIVEIGSIVKPSHVRTQGLLPNGFRLVTCYPLIESRGKGPLHASAALFEKKHIIMVPEEANDYLDLLCVRDLLEEMGAIVHEISAKDRDSILAETANFKGKKGMTRERYIHERLIKLFGEKPQEKLPKTPVSARRATGEAAISQLG
jgi:prephenate dehydrogenase